MAASVLNKCFMPLPPAGRKEAGQGEDAAPGRRMPSVPPLRQVGSAPGMPEKVRRRWAIRLWPHRGRRAGPPWRRGSVQGWLGLRPMSPGASPCGSWPQPSSRPELPLPRGASPPAPDFPRRSGCAGGRGPSPRRRCRTRGSGGLRRVLRGCPLRPHAGPGRLPLPRPRGLRVRSAAIQPRTEPSAPACGCCLNLCLCLSPCRLRCVCLRLRSPPPRGRRARRGCRSRMPASASSGAPPFPPVVAPSRDAAPARSPESMPAAPATAERPAAAPRILISVIALPAFPSGLLSRRGVAGFASPRRACRPGCGRRALPSWRCPWNPCLRPPPSWRRNARRRPCEPFQEAVTPVLADGAPIPPALRLPFLLLPFVDDSHRPRPRDAQDGGAGMRAQRRLHRAWP